MLGLYILGILLSFAGYVVGAIHFELIPDYSNSRYHHDAADEWLPFVVLFVAAVFWVLTTPVVVAFGYYKYKQKKEKSN